MKKHRRGPRAPGRTGKRRAPTATAEPQRTYSHPLFGEIPMLPVHWTDAKGNEHVYYRYDPDYVPPHLPRGAVRGDVRRQNFCWAHDTPRYFYVDQQRRCVQCDHEFVFSAREQKHWYETLQFNFASVAIRCRECRKKRRSDKALYRAVERAKRQLDEAAEEPALQLALAEALVTLRERFERGSLNEAIAAARKARALHPAPVSASWRAETLFWEASAQALAGRDDQARAAYQAFLADARGKAQREHVRRAQAWLEAHPPD